MINVVKGLWRSSKETEWERCINRYWHLDSVQRNLEAERRMENLNPQVFEKYNAEQFYDLLANQRSGYYRWKFGAQQADGNLKALQTFSIAGSLLFFLIPSGTGLLSMNGADNYRGIFQSSYLGEECIAGRFLQ